MPTNRNLIKAEVATYAKVLLQAAQAENKVFEVNAQLHEALSTIRGHMDLHDALEDASQAPETRSAIVKGVFKGYDEALVSVLALMAERGFIDRLSRVCEAYTDAAEEATDSVVVDVTTAVALTDELRETIKNKLSAQYGNKTIVLQEHVDKSILGGLIMSAHGKRIDASIVSQLERARLVLSTVPSGGDR